MPPRPGPTPRRPDGQPAWFTPQHNAYLERLLHFAPGAVLDLYQTRLVLAAQRILGENGDVAPPAYEQVGVAVAGATPRARPGHGSGNLEGLSRRGAVRIPERRGGRQRGGEHEDGGNGTGAERRPRAGPGAGVHARKPVPAPAAGERVQRGRVGNARDTGSGNGSVSSRTRSRSVRRGSGRRGSASLEEFAYVRRML